MPFDFAFGSPVQTARQIRGKRSHLTGMAAEDAVCRRYLAMGYELVATRKRCPEGEIDLLLRSGPELVAVEVKSGATLDQAASHATQAQLWRVSMACERCMQDMADDGICDMRLDLALVDAQGQIDILQGIFLD